MDSGEVMERWRAELAELTLVDSGDRVENATANMLVFELADAQDAGIAAMELAAFIHDAFRAYSRAAAKGGHHGVFYAWHDEQAGQLRMSAAWVESAADLPFRRAIKVIDETEPIAEDAIDSEYAHGIPLPEDDDDDDDGDEPDEPTPPALTVFARPLIRVV